MIKMFETWIYGKDGKRAIEKDPYLESCMRNHVFIAAGTLVGFMFAAFIFKMWTFALIGLFCALYFLWLYLSTMRIVRQGLYECREGRLVTVEKGGYRRQLCFCVILCDNGTKYEVSQPSQKIKKWIGAKETGARVRLYYPSSALVREKDGNMVLYNILCLALLTPKAEDSRFADRSLQDA
jgi:hypothetical protein